MIASRTPISVPRSSLADEVDAGAQVGVVHHEPVAPFEVAVGQDVAAHQLVELIVGERLEEDAAAMNLAKTGLTGIASEGVEAVRPAMPVRPFAVGDRRIMGNQSHLD